MRLASLGSVVGLRGIQLVWPFLGIFVMGCLVTDKIEFTTDDNFPPSIVGAPEAQHPLNQIGGLDLDADPPPETEEYVLETLVRDVNVDQVLDYRLFKDADEFTPSIQSGVIPPFFDPGLNQNAPERPFNVNIPFTQMLPAGVCHKFELVVAGEFLNFSQPREPVEDGDIDTATWWVRVVADATPITQECQ